MRALSLILVLFITSCSYYSSTNGIVVHGTLNQKPPAQVEVDPIPDPPSSSVTNPGDYEPEIPIYNPHIDHTHC